MGEAFPVHKEAEEHAQSQPRRDAVVDVSAFAGPYARVKGNRTFQDAHSRLERRIEEVRIEFQVDPWVQPRHQILKGGVAAELVRCSYIGKGDCAKMLQFEHLAGEEVAIMHVER